MGTSGLIGGSALIGSECVRVDHRGGARHRGELGPGRETAALAQRHTGSPMRWTQVHEHE
jgi:hypothetical protein